MDNTNTVSFPKSAFTNVLVRENNLDRQGFVAWFLYPGMECGAHETWWGAKVERTRPHEGVDLCFYRGVADNIFHIDNRTKIPAMYDGTVVKIIGDFIGKTIIMKPSFPDIGKGTFLTIYGHTDPVEGLEAGQSVKAGEIITTLAAPPESKALLPHLHLTLAWTPEPIPYSMLDWTTIGNPDVVRLIDPLRVIDARKELRPLWLSKSTLLNCDKKR
jgi:murein DD-endopeptidase MepM/ murein hydrolase activator NlpD